MTNTKFTGTDYYTAAISRRGDVEHLKTNQPSIIFTLYSAGVAVECLLRAFITRNTSSFDSKHDLKKLYIDSQLALKLSDKEKVEFESAINKLNNFWNNNLRYTSEKRMIRILGHEIARSKMKDINKYVDSRYRDLLEASNTIILIGESKWK